MSGRKSVETFNAAYPIEGLQRILIVVMYVNAYLRKRD
jgi:hypothetical protein